MLFRSSPLFPELLDARSGLGDDLIEAVPPPTDLRRRAPEQPSRTEQVRVELKAWRSHAARATGVAPSFILDDQTLDRIAASLPTTEQQLAAVEGVGPLLAQRLAARVLPVITAAAGSRPATRQDAGTPRASSR